MKTMKLKKSKILLIAMLIVIIIPGNILAYENLDIKQEIMPRADGTYSWAVTSKTIDGSQYGPWRDGPSGRGPSTISLTNSSGYNTSVTNTISGSYNSIAAISASLNVTINKSTSYSANYSVQVPSGSIYQIIYRPKYNVYKVVESEYYNIDGYKTITGKTKISYVNVFSNFDYSWKRL